MYQKPQNIRDITKILYRFRNWLLSHDEFRTAHRFEGYISKRSQPLPNLPPGVSEKLSNNYYYTRDGRRLVEPPTKVYDSSLKQIEGGSSSQVAVTKPVVPGIPFNWTSGKFEQYKQQ